MFQSRSGEVSKFGLLRIPLKLISKLSVGYQSLFIVIYEGLSSLVYLDHLKCYFMEQIMQSLERNLDDQTP